MIIKIYYGDQLIGEKPVKNHKSAAYYLLEQMIEHHIDDWNFCELETLDEWSACFANHPDSEIAQQCRKIIESDNTVLFLEIPGENQKTESLIWSVDEKEPSLWEIVFNELKQRFDDETKRVQLD
ncbi:MAG: hypothetical protein Q4C95_08960 [Planctomycetia bacterium]|nr:hypothetical protein [Planctomycetia bacterium]